ncbi:hypothetical protein BN2476_350060 [Paraburkholderia piptadeniae]|uniref:Uncharacterized protein n=1 Tax=Paraburkholderia piptadeniae TaxID=1701573 RepID=A0A1N7S7I9_9BURK|nr:hypothetical protein BN2476_350060 [Paraburkholderia piptadeniae]
MNAHAYDRGPRRWLFASGHRKQQRLFALGCTRVAYHDSDDTSVRAEEAMHIVADLGCAGSA